MFKKQAQVLMIDETYNDLKKKSQLLKKNLTRRTDKHKIKAKFSPSQVSRKNSKRH